MNCRHKQWKQELPLANVEQLLMVPISMFLIGPVFKGNLKTKTQTGPIKRHSPTASQWLTTTVTKQPRTEPEILSLPLFPCQIQAPAFFTHNTQYKTLMAQIFGCVMVETAIVALNCAFQTETYCRSEVWFRVSFWDLRFVTFRLKPQ